LDLLPFQFYQLNTNLTDYIADLKRASLIYEFNPESPLFTRVAFEELEKNHPEKAIEIIGAHLDRYVNYPTAYFIIGLAKAHLKEYEEAEKYVAKGSSILGCEATFNYYLAEIEKIKNSLARFSKGQKVNFNMPELSEIKTEEIEINEKPKKISSKKAIVFVPESDENNKPEPETIADNINSQAELDKFLSELKGAKLQPVDESSDQDKTESEKVNQLKEDLFQNPSIASETLGGIYFAQKSYKEALLVYEKLLETKPEKADTYNKKIKEIKDLIKN
jgi:tetratricopeptide (TPR) repeat protein